MWPFLSQYPFACWKYLRERAARERGAGGAQLHRRPPRAAARASARARSARAEAPEELLVAAPPRRVLRRRHARVPLPGEGGAVARAAQLLRDARHVARDAREARDGVGRVPRENARVVRVDAQRVAAGLQRAPRGRADAERVVARELDAAREERVEARRVRLERRLPVLGRVVARAVRADVRPAEVVREEEHNVRLRARRDHVREQREPRRSAPHECHRLPSSDARGF